MLVIICGIQAFATGYFQVVRQSSVADAVFFFYFLRDWHTIYRGGQTKMPRPFLGHSAALYHYATVFVCLFVWDLHKD